MVREEIGDNAQSRADELQRQSNGWIAKSRAS
jgi:hypothetical protein